MAIEWIGNTGDTAEQVGNSSRQMADGTDTYAGRLSAWHQLGEVLGHFATYAELEQAAKADFEVVKEQLEFSGNLVDAFGMFRVDKDGSRRFLGSVGRDYEPHHHRVGGEVTDLLIGEINGGHYETMGTIDHGRIVWMQADPNVQIRVGDDTSDVLLSFITSHDGSKASEWYETVIRQVCRNSTRAGYLRRLNSRMRIKHTKRSGARIESMKDAIIEIRDVAMSMQDKLQFLASKRQTRESMTAIFDRLFPKVLSADGQAKETTRRDNILAAILKLYESNDEDAFPEQRGTSYNLLNSITNYVDHERVSRGGNRALSATLGTGATLKDKALELIIETSKGLESMPAPVSVYVPSDGPTIDGLLGEVIANHQ